LSFEPPPTPVPLLVMETVASSKLHEDAADTIDALERRSEDTKLLRTLILAVTDWSWRRASGRWMQRTPGSLRFAFGVSAKPHGLCALVIFDLSLQLTSSNIEQQHHVFVPRANISANSYC
jgi:hypothetical protein